MLVNPTRARKVRKFAYFSVMTERGEAAIYFKFSELDRAVNITIDLDLFGDNSADKIYFDKSFDTLREGFMTSFVNMFVQNTFSPGTKLIPSSDYVGSNGPLIVTPYEPKFFLSTKYIRFLRVADSSPIELLGSRLLFSCLFISLLSDNKSVI